VGSDLTTADILTRLDAMEARSSAERASIRAENRYLTGFLVLGLLALAGVQVHYGDLGLTSGDKNVTVATTVATPPLDPLITPAAEAVPAADAAPAPSAEPATSPAVAPATTSAAPVQ